jgi:hypothetical protein
MERVDRLGHFLKKCEFVYTNGSQKTVENCEFFMTTLQNAIIVNKMVNDAYLFEPRHSQPYRRH